MDYVEAFKNLKTNNKYSRKSPHKAVLLLTIIDLFESCVLKDNIIRLDDTLTKAFAKMWNMVLPDETTFFPDAYIPFWFMQSEGFWHIVPIRGKEDILNILRDTHVKPSESKLKDCVDYVELDEDLYFLMTLQSGRSSLKRALLETYTKLSTIIIDKLSLSSDNFVDNSEVALNDYEGIINAKKMKNIEISHHYDKEVENQFNELPEDIQYIFIIEYYSFLKNNFREREMFKEICPTVFDLYDRIVFNPIRKDDLFPSFSFTYENFLADLKIKLLSEEGVFDVIDKINDAIVLLQQKESLYPTSTVEEVKEVDIQSKSKNSSSNKQNLRPLTPSLENRNCKPWSENEEELISLFYKQGYGLDDIATAMGRAEVSVKLRMASLGLFEDSFETDIFEPLIKDKFRDFFISNIGNSCFIFNLKGDCIFSTTGKLKIFHEKVYRFNYKEMCFTVKDLRRTADGWDKGTKKLVAYSNSDLYQILDEYNFIDQIEDFVEDEQMRFNKLSIDGKWYSFNGYYIGTNTL